MILQGQWANPLL
jgi:hypothetical protein